MSSCLPYDCGLTLPLEQRYTDFRFRRCCHNLKRADRAERIELSALLRILPARYARWGFHGRGAWLRDAEALGLDQAEVEPYYRANLEALNPDVCLALSNAMRDGGWKPHNPLPDVFRFAFRTMRASGMSMERIAEAWDYPYWTVSYAFRVPHGQRLTRRSVGLVL